MATSMIFVDGTNLDARFLEFFGRDDVDFPKFFAKVSDGTQLQRVHYCAAPYIQARDPAKYARQVSVFNFLRTQSNVTLYFGRFHLRPFFCWKCKNRLDVPKEKGTDILVASRLLEAAFHKRADRLILPSNDNDYWPAIRMGREHGVEMFTAVVIDPNRPTGRQLQKLLPLRKEAHGTLMLDQAFMHDCWR